MMTRIHSLAGRSWRAEAASLWCRGDGAFGWRHAWLLAILLLLAGRFTAASAQTNLIANPGFESGVITGWSTSYGNYSVVTGFAHTGTYAGKVNYGSAIRQTVTGLSPSTTYTCTAWLKVQTAGQTVYLGAQNYGVGSASMSVNTTAYSLATITFTTGSANTAADIFIYDSGADPSYCDDVTLLGNAVGDATGTSARRIADCLQRFGINTFSRVLYNGAYPWAWGGSQGAYDATNTAAAVNYLTAGSGLTVNLREYHKDYGGANPITPAQVIWMKSVFNATQSPFTVSLGVNATANDIPGMITILNDSISSGLNYVKWMEGINEPNNDFGNGKVPIATASAVQTALFDQVHAITSNVKAAAPSVIFGFPGPAGWLTGYLSTYKQSILDHSDVDNVHVYPPKSPNAGDGNAPGGALTTINTAYNTAMPGKPKINTEWHTSLYSSLHKNVPAYDAYWAPIYLVSSTVDFDWQANFWFALFDYSAAMPCGLFATDSTNPKPVGRALRALFQLTGDHGATKSTFTPGKLNVTVTGLPAAPASSPLAGGRWVLFENSANQYFLLVWNEQNDINATTTPVTVTFNSHNMTKVEEFNITAGSTTAVQTVTNVHAMTVNLDTSMRLLRITY